ncbi:DUF2919 family protein [Colwellia psychrerythraea]|uniref:DUF2919 domain-containing protein n=1 Tax=Colwellia psychrerythraea TaxID=28229 RepID=A0A099KCI2_COLPS|nr:DUF2919 family protein [Colwellia psychrerythraea]KGJ87737.1 Protein of unknown function DUF2919 [Colwellia psychrerythraea]
MSTSQAPKTYQEYSIEDFDKFDCLKLSKRFYIVLLFVLRGYLVWLMSVTNMKDRVGTMQWIYPETNLFFLSLISGVIGLFVVLIISLRRPDAPKWIQQLWPYCRTLLVGALIFDFIINLIGFFYWQLSSIPWLVCQGAIVFALIILCFTSKRLQINLSEFPQTLPEK